MQTPQPTLVFVPGSWHRPSCYSRIIEPLIRDHRQRCVSVTLPSTNGDPAATFKDDLDAAVSAVREETEQGRDVVLVAHSYGGMVANSAIKGFAAPPASPHGAGASSSSPQNTAGTDRGHVVGLILIASGHTLTGLSFMDPFLGRPPPAWRANNETGFAELVADPRDFFYHDLPDEDAARWVAQLTPQSLRALYEGAEYAYAGWLDVPSMYIGTVEDRGLPVAAQRMSVGMARGMGASVVHRELQTSHSPFLSQPDAVVALILEALDSFRAHGSSASNMPTPKASKAIVPQARLWQPSSWFRFGLPLGLGRAMGWGVAGFLWEMAEALASTSLEPSPARYVDFPCVQPDASDKEGKPVLNRYSTFLTREHDFPGAKAMLYAAGVPHEEAMKNSPHVGIASVWWEGNSCNMHLLDLSKAVKAAVQKKGFLPWQYSTVGVSDGIAQGHEGMRFSLQSRELIADNVETITCSQAHDACIAIPGCDKNMPGCVMAIARHNRPSVVIYGGTVQRGCSKLLRRPIDINTCYEAQGAYLFGALASWDKDGKASPEDILSDIERHAVPGPGACGGMYTANSMATIIETLGLSLPGSSSSPAASPSKMKECEKAAEAIAVCMERNIRPRDLLTKESFENALVVSMAVGGSTNTVLHMLAMAKTAGVPLTLADFQRVSRKTPLISNLLPSGKYSMEDLHKIGGIPSVLKLLIAGGLVNGKLMTVTGKTMEENVASWPSLPLDQDIIRPLSDPVKQTSHITILYGNIAPGGAVAKITGKEGVRFTGKAQVFERESGLVAALNNGDLPKTENLVLVVRYEGPKGGPGMPEQLKASATLIGANFRNIALITDGRYSGASHGFIVGHIVPEAAVGGPIAVVENGDEITIDAEAGSISMAVSDAVIRQRLEAWRPPRRTVTRGTLAKYAALVGSASDGAVTDLF